MGKAIRTGTYVLVLWVALLSLFAGISYYLLKQDRQKSVQQFKSHAAFIADDIWAIDKLGATSYLQLAVQADHYKRLQVILSSRELFVDEKSEPLTGLDGFLYQLGIITVRNVHADIVYKGRNIGVLQGEQYVRLIYPLTNVLVFLLLVFLVALFMFYLLNNRKRLENLVIERTRNLQKSEKRFHDFVNLLPEMVWESDREGFIRFANQVAITRFNLKTTNEEPWFSLIVKEQQAAAGQEFEASMQGYGSGLQEFKAIDKDGVTFPLLIRAAPIISENEVIGARCVAIDISERHQLQEELNQATKMKAIGLMAGGVAHDLNNILSGVVSYPELLLLKLPVDSEYRKPIEAIKKSGVEAAGVVSDLLTVARGIAASRSVRKVNDLIEDYSESPDFKKLQSGNPGIDFRFLLDDRLLNINCSPIHVRKCLMNLVTNAAEAIDGLGRVTVITANHTVIEDSADIPSLPPGEYVKVIVRDSGGGVSEDDLRHIFEPFYTRKVMGRSGTGLGLTVVWNTMRDHNGTVTVERIKQETVFTLYFPGTVEEVSTTDSGVDLEALKGDGQHILVVDDEPQQLDITSQLLKTLNYKVSTVSSGEMAIEFFAKQQAELVILDMIMDPGINGYLTYKGILEMVPGQRAIIASGYSESENVKKAMKMGAGAYLTKPFTIEQLGGAVEKVLKQNGK